jgi:cytoplasmic iron level regulating protein YaaA (DUF328/UPF0246 family)
MTIAEIVKDRIDVLSITQQTKILEFISSIEVDNNLAKMSENSLSDWNNNEEEKAWKNYQ